MKQVLYGFLGLVLFTVFTPLQAQDYYKEPKNWPTTHRIGTSEFYRLASGNDTLTALVNLYMRKRETGKTAFIVAGASTATTVIAIPFVILASWGNGGNPDKAINTLGTVYGLTFYTSIGIGSSKYLRYTRKKLLTQMIIYHEKGTIPEPVRRNFRDRDFPPGLR